MIKINLLNSVTERKSGAAMVVERKISSPASRLLVMALAVGFLLAAVVGWDVISTQMAKTEAERQLEEQKQVAAQLEAVMKEQKELEDKIKTIDGRIEAIKKLRNSQAGPSAVLEAVSERIGMYPEIYLDSVEQSGEQVTVKGNSPNEEAVTKFGGSLEFSNGLFTNLNIETQKTEVQTASAVAPSADAPKTAVINFTIRCAYKAANAGKKDGAPMTAANAPQAQNPAPTAPPAPQVAKNN